MDKYDVKNLPLPIKPGEMVYFEVEGQIEAIVATSVGIDLDGRLLVVCEDLKYEIGIEDRAFLTEADAKKYIADIASIPSDYGVIQYKKLKLPCYPGTTYYFCDDNEFDGWAIFKEDHTYVFFDEDGSVRSGDGESEGYIIGGWPNEYFKTLREAQEYIREQIELFGE